jgi:transcriptional regulator with XRE-family HTH domain
LSTIAGGTIGHIFSDCTMDVKAEYGKKVREIRKNRGVSQEGLADLAGLDRTYISDIENGKRNVSIETIFKIAYALENPLINFFEFNKDS